ncbi:MAG TPA: bifunctional (p)ppGpp synthetase/guanosine-3',5'-bis(diphosphate) 3'-pyrophosphohydrolase [Candidatus Eisenbacteria bacterium]|nr:bifunctional (p)ppGpp synthetase/guanosine-3',5'-bis(diphosphate) 3'-pyrophosphohydrolase [Candidatus Eisenbacteria bacterium]
MMRQLIEQYKFYSGMKSGEKIWQAYQFSKEAHEGQKRATGEDYIVHPVATLEILIDIEVDQDTLIASLLHDVAEDTEYSLKDIHDQFGDDVALLVDGVTKLNKIHFSSREEVQAESYRKMFLAMAEDIRVVLIKLADRLHNMRTIRYMIPEKQKEKAQETLDIYTPLASRLGIYKIKWELEDICLRYLDPDSYYELVGAIAQKRSERENYLENIVAKMNMKISEIGIEAEIEGRPKHFYSIYKKMKAQHKNLDEIYDLFATRVIVPTVGDCYAVLGLVHELFKPMPGRFKDYIAMPKANMYQSLHSTVVGPEGVPFEVQIRTHEMHKTAEYGIAAHWLYKEGKTTRKNVQEMETKLTWLRQLLEWQKDMSDASEFMDLLKTGLVVDEVFVFTPKGEVKSLTAGSIPIDFAYQIHSEIGNSMYGAKVNGRMVPLNYKLENGDIVEILTSDKVQGPSRDWLNIVKTSSAKSKIRNWFKRQMRDDNIVRGKEKLEREIEKIAFRPSQLVQKKYYEPILEMHSFQKLDDLYAAIGYGGVSTARVVPRLKNNYIKSLPDEERNKLGYRLNSKGEVIYSPDSILSKEDLIRQTRLESQQNKMIKDRERSPGITVTGLENVLVKLARCCSPVPGDSIIGYITRGTGVSVHRTNCPNIQSIVEKSDNSPEDAERASRLIEVSWTDNNKADFYVDLRIIGRDRPRLLADISHVIAEENFTIISGQLQSAKDMSANILLTIKITNNIELEKLIGRIKVISGVTNVIRGH